jgi:5'-3' exonuclease
MPDKLYVIDGMAYAFRSYFAIKNLRDSKGTPHERRFRIRPNAAQNPS